MSRTIDSSDQTQMEKQFGVEPILIVEIDWTGSDIKYYSSKGLGNEDGSTPESAIGSMMGIENFSEQIKVGNSGQINNISLDLMGVRSYFDNNILQGIPVKITQYFWNESALTNGTLMFAGKIASPISWSESTDTLSFDVISSVPDTEYGFALEESGSYSFTPDDDVYDVAYPLIFGEVLNVPALKVQSGAVGKLITSLNRTIATVEVENGEKFEQDTSMTVLFGTIVCTGTFSGNTFTITTRNIARYSSLSVASVPGGDVDEDNYCVIWINDVVTAKGSFLYDDTLKMYNYCFRQETVGNTTKCWCSVKWGSWATGSWIDERPATIDTIAGAVINNWKGQIANYLTSWSVKVDSGVCRLNGDGSFHSDATAIYVCALTSGTILDVKAYRTIEKEKILVNIPTSYYTITSENMGGVGDSIVLTMTRLLSTRDDEGWGDDIFVSIDSDLTNNTASILKWLLDTYSSLATDETSWTNMVPVVDNYPSNFALFDQGDTLKICEEIAWQARMALRVSNNIVFMEYLSLEPSVISAIVDNEDFELKTTHLSLTDETELITKFVAKWKKSYSPEDKVQSYILKENVTEYGLTTSEYDFWIYNIKEWAEKSANFWAHRFANIWKLLSFDTFMENLNLESMDAVTLVPTIHNIVTEDVIAIVQGVSIEQSRGKVGLSLWLPVIEGLQVQDVDAYMEDLEDRIDVDVSDLREFNYEIELEQEASESRRSSSRTEDKQSVGLIGTVIGYTFLATASEGATAAVNLTCVITGPNSSPWNLDLNRNYIVGEPVTYSSKTYISRTSHAPTGGNAPTPGGNTNWIDLTAAEVYFTIQGTNFLNQLTHPILTDDIFNVYFDGTEWKGVQTLYAGLPRRAFVKTTPTGTTVPVYLDTDNSAYEVTVTVNIAGGGNLPDAEPKLEDGVDFWVTNNNGTWRNLTTFHAMEDCDT